MAAPEMQETLRHGWVKAGLDFLDDTPDGRAKLEEAFNAAVADHKKGFLFKNHGTRRQFGAVSSAVGGHGRMKKDGETEEETQVHDLLADPGDFLDDKKEELTHAQASKAQKMLEQARTLLEDLGKPAAKAAATGEAKAGKRKR